MDTTNELIYLLDRYQVRHIDVLTNTRAAPEPKENRYYEYYIGLREGRWTCDDAAAAHFGFESGAKTWARFKNSVKKRILNTVLFIDTNLPEFDDCSRATVTIARQWAVAKTVADKGVQSLYLELMYKVLEGATRFEIFDIAQDAVRSIMQVIVQDPAARKEYQRLQEIHRQLLDATVEEIRVRQAFQSLMMQLCGKKGYKKDIAALAQSLVAELAPLAVHNQTVGFQFKYRLIDIYTETLRHNWPQALLKIRACKVFLQQHPISDQSRMAAVCQQEAACLIMTGDASGAENILEATLQLLPEGAAEWFKTFELAVVNALYASRYTDAWQILKTVVHHPRFGFNVPAMDKETWRLFQAYLSFLVKRNKIQLSPREKGDIEKFRLNSWLNDLPLYSQDKRGGNIPMLIFQALFLLHENQTDAFDNRVEALRKYRQRNLDPQSEHYRTDCFIRLLELIPKKGYQKLRIEAEARPLLNKLRAMSPDILDRSFEIEIVPYEVQWEWVLEILGK